MYTCVLCRKREEGEEGAILFVNKYGTPKPLCPACENLLDTATGEDITAAADARKELLRVTDGIRDREAMRVLQSVLAGESAPEETEEDLAIEEAYEKVRQSDEEREEEEREEEERRKFENSFLSWLPVIALGVIVVGFFVFWFFIRPMLG